MLAVAVTWHNLPHRPGAAPPEVGSPRAREQPLLCALPSTGQLEAIPLGGQCLRPWALGRRALKGHPCGEATCCQRQLQQGPQLHTLAPVFRNHLRLETTSVPVSRGRGKAGRPAGVGCVSDPCRMSPCTRGRMHHMAKAKQVLRCQPAVDGGWGTRVGTTSRSRCLDGKPGQRDYGVPASGSGPCPRVLTSTPNPAHQYQLLQTLFISVTEHLLLASGNPHPPRPTCHPASVLPQTIPSPSSCAPTIPPRPGPAHQPGLLSFVHSQVVGKGVLTLTVSKS